MGDALLHYSKIDFRKRVKSGHDGAILRCLLYPQKRTSEVCLGMSALCQKLTFHGHF